MFNEAIEAWANGPVVREIYEKHRGEFLLSGWPHGDPKRLSKDQRETVDVVLQFYGEMPAQALSDLTHSEAPWKEARSGLAPGERGNAVIALASMAEYCGSL